MKICLQVTIRNVCPLEKRVQVWEKEATQDAHVLVKGCLEQYKLPGICTGEGRGAAGAKDGGRCKHSRASVHRNGKNGSPKPGRSPDTALSLITNCSFPEALP